MTAFVGRNGQGKTNLVEAIDYIARLASHRVAGDAPLVRLGADQAVVRAAVVRDGRRRVLEVEINPGRSNRARINRSPLPRARELLGLVRTVLFSPEDLALVKGDPSERRHFLDDLLVQRAPRLRRGARRLRPGAQAAQLAAQDRRRARRQASRRRRSALATLGVWDAHLARARRRDARRPAGAGRRRCGRCVGKAYEAVARGRDPRPTRRWPTSRRSAARRPTGADHDARSCEQPCWPSWSAAAATRSTAGSAWSARTATT